MDEAHGQHDESLSNRTSRRTALLGTLGLAGTALVAGGFALVRFRSPFAPNNSPPPFPIPPEPRIPRDPSIPQRPLPDFTRVPRSENEGAVVERALQEGAELYLLSWESLGLGAVFTPNETFIGRWIPIAREHRMSYVSHAAIAWLTPDEAAELAESSEIDSIQLVNSESIPSLQSQIGSNTVVVTTATDQDTIAAHWQRRLADQPYVRVLVVEGGNFPIGGIGDVPEARQVLIESSNAALPNVITEIARDSHVYSINRGGIRMNFFCPPCGMG